MSNDEDTNPFWVMVDRDVMSFFADLVADTYEFIRRQLVQLMTTCIQGVLVFGIWNWIVHPSFFPHIGYWAATGIALIAKILLPIHRTDVVPPLTEEELNAIAGENEGEPVRSIERTAQSKGVKLKTKVSDTKHLN